MGIQDIPTRCSDDNTDVTVDRETNDEESLEVELTPDDSDEEYLYVPGRGLQAISSLFRLHPTDDERVIEVSMDVPDDLLINRNATPPYMEEESDDESEDETPEFVHLPTNETYTITERYSIIGETDGESEDDDPTIERINVTDLLNSGNVMALLPEGEPISEYYAVTDLFMLTVTESRDNSTSDMVGVSDEQLEDDSTLETVDVSSVQLETNFTSESVEVSVQSEGCSAPKRIKISAINSEGPCTSDVDVLLKINEPSNDES